MRRISTKGRHFERKFRNRSYPVIGWVGIVGLWVTVTVMIGLAVVAIVTEGFDPVLLFAFVIPIGAVPVTWWLWNWYVRTLLGVDRAGIFIRNPRTDVEVSWSDFRAAEVQPVNPFTYAGGGWPLVIRSTLGEPISVFCVQTARGTKVAGGSGYAEHVAADINRLAEQYRSSGSAPSD